MYRAHCVAHYLSLLAPRLLAAPAELLLQSVGDLPRNSDVLEVNAGAGLLTTALCKRVAQADGSLVVTDEDPKLIRHLSSTGPHPLALGAQAQRLPFLEQEFDVVVAGGVLGQRLQNARMLKDFYRVLRKGGTLYATGFLRGSFEELFDLFLEVCEAEGDTAARDALQILNANMLDVDETRTLMTEGGFEEVHIGACEQALFFPGGSAAVQDPLISEIVLPVWFPQLRPAPETLAHLAETVNTYFGESRFALTVRTAIVSATVA